MDWPSRPKIQAGPIVIDLTPALETVIYSFEEDLSNIIQETISKQINVKTLVKEAPAEIPKYNYIRTKDIDLWIKIDPVSLLVQSQPEFRNDSIIVSAGLSSKLQIRLAHDTWPVDALD